MNDETLQGILVFSKKVGKAIEKVIPCNRIALIVLGLEIPHAHIHLIPMDKESDTHFSNPKLKLSPEEFTEIAEKIKAVL